MEPEIYDKIVLADHDTLIDCLAISTTANFYDVMKKLEVDLSKIHTLNKGELVNALKAEVKHRIIRG